MKDEDMKSDTEKKEYKERFAKWEQEQYDVTIGDLLQAGLPNLFHLEIEKDQHGDSRTISPKKNF